MVVKKNTMGKIEPFSIIAAILALIGFWFSGVIATGVLILGAILVSVSWRRFKNNKKYTVKWPLYVGAGIVALAILIRVLGITLIALF
jgi:hypothetical protein